MISNVTQMFYAFYKPLADIVLFCFCHFYAVSFSKPDDNFASLNFLNTTCQLQIIDTKIHI